MSAPATTLPGAHPAPAEHGAAHAAVSNQRFGMLLFLASEAVMFGAIFAQYFYARAQAVQWPPDGHERVPAFPLALLLTLFLAASGVTAHNADTAIRRDDQEGLRSWLAATALLGVLFLGGQAYEYTTLILHEGFTPSSGIYGTSFFMLTGLHGLHVTGGVIVLAGVLVRAGLGHFDARHHFGVEGTVLYWHFVDVVWFALYASLYLL